MMHCASAFRPCLAGVNTHFWPNGISMEIEEFLHLQSEALCVCAVLSRLNLASLSTTERKQTWLKRIRTTSVRRMLGQVLGIVMSNRWKTVQDNVRDSFFTVLCSPFFLAWQCSMRFSAGFMAFTCTVCTFCRFAFHCFEVDLQEATDMLEVPDGAQNADMAADSSVAGTM